MGDYFPIPFATATFSWQHETDRQGLGSREVLLSLRLSWCIVGVYLDSQDQVPSRNNDLNPCRNVTFNMGRCTSGLSKCPVLL